MNIVKDKFLSVIDARLLYKNIIPTLKLLRKQGFSLSKKQIDSIRDFGITNKEIRREIRKRKEFLKWI